MRIIPTGVLQFTPPKSDDVIGFNLYYREPSSNFEGVMTSEDNKVFVKSEDVEIVPSETKGKVAQIDLDEIDWKAEGGLQGNCRILFAVSAVDDVGNESSISEGVIFQFEQEVPDAPHGLMFFRTR